MMETLAELPLYRGSGRLLKPRTRPPAAERDPDCGHVNRGASAGGEEFRRGTRDRRSICRALAVPRSTVSSSAGGDEAVPWRPSKPAAMALAVRELRSGLP